MILEPLRIPGCFAIKTERKQDNRGYFERDFSAHDFKDFGLVSEWVQENTSFNSRMGTVRGLHFQLGGVGETKLIKCVQGSVFDVFLDLRKDSKTFGECGSLILAEDLPIQLYLPTGIAHGYQTLSDNSMLRYLHSAEYQSRNARSINFRDPKLAISWPIGITMYSKEDDLAPTFEEFLESYEL